MKTTKEFHMSDFIITISPFRAPFMRERMEKIQTVCKYRNGYKYEYSEYAYGKPHCGRVYRWAETKESKAEKDRHMPAFMKRVETTFNKALARYRSEYAGINYEDEVVSTYAPYPQCPTALKSVMSERWNQYQIDRAFLNNIVSRMRIQFGHLMTSAQTGEYDRIGDSLYRIHKYYIQLSSLCRPSHHIVEYRKIKGICPLLANRR
jgi:hypothetical protein